MARKNVKGKAIFKSMCVVTCALRASSHDVIDCIGTFSKNFQESLVLSLLVLPMLLITH